MPTVSQSFIDTHPKSVAANPGRYTVASSPSNSSNQQYTPSASSAPETSWNLSKWQTDGTGKFSQTPTLTINGKAQTYKTPDEYINALSGLKSQGQSGPLDQFINEFNNVRGEFKIPTTIDSSVMGSAAMPKAVPTTSYTPASSNLQATLGINTNPNMNTQMGNQQLIQQGNPGYSKQQMQIRNGQINNTAPAGGNVVNTMGSTPADPNAYANSKITNLGSTLPQATQGALAPILSEYDQTQKQLNQESASRAQLQIDNQVIQKNKLVNDLAIKELEAKNAYDMQVAKIRENASGSFGGAMQQDLSKAEIDYTNKSVSLGIQKALANNDLESANNLVKLTLDSTYEPLKTKLASLKTSFDMHKDDMTESEKLVAQAQIKKAENEAKPDTQIVDLGNKSVLIDKNTGKITQTYQKGKSPGTTGSGRGTGTGGSGLYSPELIQAVSMGLIAPQAVNSRTAAFYNAIAKSGVDAVSANAGSKAQIESVTDLAKYSTAVSRVVNILDKNMPLLSSIADKVNTLGVPILDNKANGLVSAVSNNTDIAKYVNTLNTIRSEYAQMLSRGGEVTVELRKEAKDAIPAGQSGEVYRQIGKQLKLESQGIKDGINQTFTEVNQKPFNANVQNAKNTPTSGKTIPAGYYQASDGKYYKK